MLDHWCSRHGHALDGFFYCSEFFSVCVLCSVNYLEFTEQFCELSWNSQNKKEVTPIKVVAYQTDFFKFNMNSIN
jgi:hypothetical protein